MPLGTGAGTPEPGRLATLDGLRGVAILLVLVWHYVRCAVPLADPAWVRPTQALSLTWSGVDLFFVLSGFLIGGILFDHRESASYFRTFYVRRACRILPLYALTLVAFLAAFAFLRPFVGPTPFVPSMPLWTYVLFLQNVSMAFANTMGASFLGATWSLAVEEQFYLILPVVVRVARPSTVAFSACLTLVLAPLVRIFANVSLGWTAAFVLLPARADALMLGVLVAFVWRRPEVRTLLRAQRTRLRGLVLAMAAGTLYLAFYNDALGPADHSWLALLYGGALLLALVDEESWVGRILRLGWLTRLGLWSYGIYMFHQPTNALLHRLILGRDPMVTSSEGVAVTLLALVLTLALAALSFRVFERPILRYGHSFRY